MTIELLLKTPYHEGHESPPPVLWMSVFEPSCVVPYGIAEPAHGRQPALLIIPPPTDLVSVPAAFDGVAIARKL